MIFSELEKCFYLRLAKDGGRERGIFTMERKRLCVLINSVWIYFLGCNFEKGSRILTSVQFFSK